MENPKKFDYDQSRMPPVRVIGERIVDGLIERLSIVTMPDGTLRAFETIRPEQAGSYAPVLFVHWFEPEEPRPITAANLRKKPASLRVKEPFACWWKPCGRTWTGSINALRRMMKAIPSGR